MFELDGTLWVQLANFLIFFAIVNVIFLRPVRVALAKRRAYIDGLRHDIEEARGEAAHARAEMREQIAEARREGAEVLTKRRAEGNGEAETIAARSSRRAGEIAARNQATIVAEISVASAGLPRLTAALADDLFRKSVIEGIV